MKNWFTILFILLVSFSNAQTEIYFETGKSTLTSTSKKVLDSLLNNIAKDDALKVHGHTDTIGSIESNIILSQKRTVSVKKYIANKGTKVSIESLALGESQNKYSENKLNRRVDITLLKTKLTEDNNEQTKEESVISIEQFLTEDKINLKNIQFKPGTADFFNQDAIDELRELRFILDSLSTIKIRIEGHVCCVNDRILSELRAKKVYWYLLDNGIDKDRLSSVGFSNTKPLVPETSAENNQKNRRVEVQIMER